MTDRKSEQRVEQPQPPAPIDPDKIDWLTRWAIERPFVRGDHDALKADGTFDYTDSPEDQYRKAHGMASEREQEWADYRHDVLADVLEQLEGR